MCGSRTFADKEAVFDYLNGLYWRWSGPDPADDSFVLIEGGADGADRIAAEWTELEPDDGIGPWHEQYPADWNVYPDTPTTAIGYRRDGTPYNRWAGPQRNARMLEEGKPDTCVAFIDKPLSESRGTKDMVARCRAAGVKTIVVWVPA